SISLSDPVAEARGAEETKEEETVADDSGSSSPLEESPDQSQEAGDSFGELFPALHEFEVEEDASVSSDAGLCGDGEGTVPLATLPGSPPPSSAVPPLADAASTRARASVLESPTGLWLPSPPSLAGHYSPARSAGRIESGSKGDDSGVAIAAAPAAAFTPASVRGPSAQTTARHDEADRAAARKMADLPPPPPPAAEASSPEAPVVVGKESGIGRGHAEEEQEWEDGAPAGVSSRDNTRGSSEASERRADGGGDTELEDCGDGSEGRGGGSDNDGGGGGSSGNDDADADDDGDGDDGDDVACGVCGCSTSKEDDPIILCDGPSHCGTAVHGDCYGVSEIPEGPWLCDHCRAHRGTTAVQPPARLSTDTPPPPQPPPPPSPTALAANPSSPGRCALCRQPGGALKLSRCGRWVHVVCVWWTPELSTEPDTVRPGSLARLDPARQRLSCSACHGRGGGAVECAEPSCLEACHPFCAMRAGLLLRESDGAFELFCRTHSLRRRRRRRRRQRSGARETGGASAEGDRAGSRDCVSGDATAGAAAAAAAAAAVAGYKTTPIVGRGRRGEEPRGGFLSTPSPWVPTPPTPSGSKFSPLHEGVAAAAASSSAGPDRRKKLPPSPSPTPSRHGSQSSPSPTPPRRRRPPQGGQAKPRRKTIALSDEDTDEDGGVSPGPREAGSPGMATTPGSRTVSGGDGSGKRASTGSGSGKAKAKAKAKGSGTPLRVFDMAPPSRLPATPTPTPLHPIPAGGGGEEDEEGSGTPSPVMRRNNRRPRGVGGGG
ncbi:unnamed protein product, partial [Hapterophycus canaliculatus]